MSKDGQKGKQAVPSKRERLPRSGARTLEQRDRKHARRQKYQRQRVRKQHKLAKRCVVLCNLLGVYVDQPHHPSLGTWHKRLRRWARLKGLIGLPLKRKKKPEGKTRAEEAESEKVDHAIEQSELLSNEAS